MKCWQHEKRTSPYQANYPTQLPQQEIGYWYGGLERGLPPASSTPTTTSRSLQRQAGLPIERLYKEGVLQRTEERTGKNEREDCSIRHSQHLLGQVT